MSTAAPVLRAVVKRGEKTFETAVFTPSINPDSKAVLTGYIQLGKDEGRTRVFAFVNDRRDTPGAKFISLTANRTNLSTGEIGFFPVAIGNVVNSRADGGEVFYDTVMFNPVDDAGHSIPDAAPIAVWVTDACDAALHAKLGFASARVARSKKSNEDNSGAEAPLVELAGEEGGDAAARAAMVAAAAHDIPL